jgi:hypothetical protein
MDDEVEWLEMDDEVEWLAQEIEDLLDAGRVGVYEFVEAARQRYPGAAAKDVMHLCRPALERVLGDPSVQLGWYIWPGVERVRPASEADVTDAAFDGIGPDPYLGIERLP